MEDRQKLLEDAIKYWKERKQITTKQLKFDTETVTKLEKEYTDLMN